MKTPSRCPWVDLGKPLYVQYHDEEWGVPVHDDQRMFEFLLLESAQAGLSWYTVLSKRENYRLAFDGFDPERIARYDRRKFEALMNNSGIIRNRLKIEAAINNARCVLEMREQGLSLAAHLWSFVDPPPRPNILRELADYPARSAESDALSKDLKRRGFRFVGSTILYAHMQATGLVNDHARGCFRRRQVSASGA